MIFRFGRKKPPELGQKIPKSELENAGRIGAKEIDIKKRKEARTRVEQAISDAMSHGISLTEDQQTNIADRLTEFYKLQMEHVQKGTTTKEEANALLAKKIGEIVTDLMSKTTKEPVDPKQYMEQLKKGSDEYNKKAA